MEGIVFDIQKFALHDGPGIRTAVFLKGCPLSCAWCANPESQLGKPQLMFLSSRCNHCMECVSYCPQGVLVNRTGKLEVNFDACDACGECLSSCTQNALRISGKSYAVEEVLEIVKKDMLYYQKSGGGLTLTGGEPLFQSKFALEILRQAKAQDIHTAIETCGAASRSTYLSAAQFTDLFLFDYKITDEQDHRQFTGIPRKSILNKLAALADTGVPIILRCIIIPGINDHHTHFSAIATLSKKYPSIKQVELMPYHQYGKGKYAQIGRQHQAVSPESATQAQAQKWKVELQNLNCKNVTVG